MMLVTPMINCGKDKPPKPTMYSVSFNANGGSPTPTTQSRELGQTVSEPTAPARNGYDFDAWYTDNNTFVNKVTFPYTVMQSITLFAKWIEWPIPTYEEAVKFPTWIDGSATVNFTNLKSNTIYLAKVNTSNYQIDSDLTGGVSGVFKSEPNTIQSFGLEDNPIPEWLKEVNKSWENTHPKRDDVVRTKAFTPPKIGDSKMFWTYDGKTQTMSQVQSRATLRAIGKYSNVWIMDENYDMRTNECIGTVSGYSCKTNSAKAQEAADWFDKIYPVQTNLLGYEYGGGPNGDGGVDGDPKIQILVFDIQGAGGYFNPVDWLPASQYKMSNEAEIFYIHTNSLVYNNNLSYSAAYVLIHEFQHMIHYNQKVIRKSLYSPTWYNELLSVMAEEVMETSIGIPSRTRQNNYMSSVMSDYHKEGLSEWTGELSYRKAFGFAAYLTRNYGGGGLLRNIMLSDYTSTQSITDGLNEYHPGMTFHDALTKYGEALIFSGTRTPNDVASFDKSAAYDFNDIEYSVYGIDIWRTYGGPSILNLSRTTMAPLAISLHSVNEWKNKNGDLSITLDQPEDESIIMYLMVK